MLDAQDDPRQGMIDAGSANEARRFADGRRAGWAAGSFERGATLNELQHHPVAAFAGYRQPLAHRTCLAVERSLSLRVSHDTLALIPLNAGYDRDDPL